jgi:hypothetical protein
MDSRRARHPGSSGAGRERSKAEDGHPPGDPALADGVQCPFCEGGDTRLVSPFGGQLSVAQYWCRRCRTGFDYMKWG